MSLYNVMPAFDAYADGLREVARHEPEQHVPGQAAEREPFGAEFAVRFVILVLLAVPVLLYLTA